MSGMWKQLFAEAPPGALEKLLSPKRKALYALFVLTPGTLLGLYLNSVKKDMERDNNRLRMDQIQEQLGAEEQQENKDLVLANSLQELRNRLQKLEAEATANRQAAAAAQKTKTDAVDVVDSAKKTATDTANAAPPPRPQKPATPASSTKSPVPHTASSGIGERIRERNEAMHKRDLEAYKAAQQAREGDN